MLKNINIIFFVFVIIFLFRKNLKRNINYNIPKKILKLKNAVSEINLHSQMSNYTRTYSSGCTGFFVDTGDNYDIQNGLFLTAFHCGDGNVDFLGPAYFNEGLESDLGIFLPPEFGYIENPISEKIEKIKGYFFGNQMLDIMAIYTGIDMTRFKDRLIKVRNYIPKVGERSFIIGTPAAQNEDHVTDGTVNSVGSYQNMASIVSQIMVSNPTLGGNSGSPITNADGVLLGMLDWGYSDSVSGGTEGRYIYKWLESIKKEKSVQILNNPNYNIEAKYGQSIIEYNQNFKSIDYKKLYRFSGITENMFTFGINVTLDFSDIHLYINEHFFGRERDNDSNFLSLKKQQRNISRNDSMLINKIYNEKDDKDRTADVSFFNRSNASFKKTDQTITYITKQQIKTDIEKSLSISPSNTQENYEDGTPLMVDSFENRLYLALSGGRTSEKPGRFSFVVKANENIELKFTQDVWHAYQVRIYVGDVNSSGEPILVANNLNDFRYFGYYDANSKNRLYNCGTWTICYILNGNNPESVTYSVDISYTDHDLSRKYKAGTLMETINLDSQFSKRDDYPRVNAAGWDGDWGNNLKYIPYDEIMQDCEPKIWGQVLSNTEIEQIKLNYSFKNQEDDANDKKLNKHMEINDFYNYMLGNDHKNAENNVVTKEKYLINNTSTLGMQDNDMITALKINGTTYNISEGFSQITSGWWSSGTKIDLEYQINEERLTDIKNQLNLDLPSGKSVWIEFELNEINKSINNLLNFSSRYLGEGDLSTEKTLSKKNVEPTSCGCKKKNNHNHHKKKNNHNHHKKNNIIKI